MNYKLQITNYKWGAVVGAAIGRPQVPGAGSEGFGRAMLAPTAFMGVRWGKGFWADVGIGPYERS